MTKLYSVLYFLLNTVFFLVMFSRFSYAETLPVHLRAHVDVNTDDLRSHMKYELFSKDNLFPTAKLTVNLDVVARHGGVLIDASQSDDPEGEPLSYHWMILSQPKGSFAELKREDLFKANLIADVTGDYIVALTVSDGEKDSTVSLLKVHVIAH